MNVKVYRADELEEEALQQAKLALAHVNDTFYDGELDAANESFRKFMDYFNVSVHKMNYRIGANAAESVAGIPAEHSLYKLYDSQEEIDNDEDSIRHYAVLRNEVKEELEEIKDEYILTGRYYDAVLADGALEELNNAEDMCDVLYAAAESLFVVIQRGYDYRSSDDYFFEMCDAMDYWFTEEGEVWDHGH